MRLLAALAFALLLVAAFPFRAGDLRFDLGALAGWVALLPLAWLIDGLRPLRAAVWAGASATLGFCGVLFWIFVVVHDAGQAPVWVGLAAVAGLSAVCGAHVGLAAFAARALEPAPGHWAGRASWCVLPAAWVAAEHLRSIGLLGGFPWALLGYAVHDDGPARVLASLVGVYGLSFLLASTAVLLYRRRPVHALAVVAIAHMLGLALGLRASGDTPELRVAVVQANIPQGEKWDPGRASAAFDRHLYLSGLAAASRDLDLIVWPETAVPILLENDAAAREQLAALARGTGAALVIGGVGIENDGRSLRFYNSAFAVNAEGVIVDRYDKSVLVPFGEYVPMRPLLGFLSALATGMAGETDVSAGPGPRTLKGLAALDSDHAAAVLICYEVIYPSVVRGAVRKGARLLLNVTNDAWYGRTSAPHQFLAISAMRSAEHGIPMLRAANTGVSAVVDAQGRVSRQTEIFEGTVFVASVPGALKGMSPYTRFGDWVVWASWGWLAILAVLRAIARTQDDKGERRGDSRDVG